MYFGGSVTVGEVASTVIVTTTGVGWLTRMPALALAVPPGPLALMVYVVDVAGLTFAEPCEGTEPTSGEILSWVASVEVQVRVDMSPLLMEYGLACSVTVGGGGGGGPLAPPPHAHAPKTRRTRKSELANPYTGTAATCCCAPWYFLTRSNRMTKSATISARNPYGKRKGPPSGGAPVAAPGLEVTVIVRVLVSVPLGGNIPEAGLKLQETPARSPWQAKAN